MKKKYNQKNGQLLWKKAKKIIPGGNMLLSKRSEMFAPDQWNPYFKKSNKYNVWTLDGKKFIDMFFGVGTNTLGYCNTNIDNAVKKSINNGTMSSLNCPEEVFLAEKLLEINPWASMVKFARTGGEANAIAIRIARAASGKDNIAICGYHGWHDWYLAANLSEQNALSNHLLPGLRPSGVPKKLLDTTFPFNFNDINALKKLIQTKNIGVIKMEVYRNYPPKDNFLKKVRKLATDNNIVLIFDECTSGFRQTYGGLFNIYNVIPDVVLFSKALGNGYAISALVGKKEIMENAQNSFISSTFWTERIGYVAALATLKEMKRQKSWIKITKVGNYIYKGWKKIAKDNFLDINFYGIPALKSFSFNSKNHLAYKTYLSQEMQKKGIIASNLFYASTVHDKKIINKYFDELNKIFKVIKDCEEGRDIKKLLKGPICHNSFKRLN